MGIESEGIKSNSASQVYIHETAIVDMPCQIGEGTRIWHFSHVREGVKIGRNCVIGQNVYIANGVIIGDNVKIQNNVSVYEGVILEDDVFVGPSAVFTNVRKPRSAAPTRDYQTTHIKRGATIGANATLVCGITVGRDAMIGAGCVVVRSVPDGVLVVGNPARIVKTLTGVKDDQGGHYGTNP